MFDVFISNFKLFFVHYFWAMAALLFLYFIYLDYFAIKKPAELISDEELMNRYVEAKRKGIIK